MGSVRTGLAWWVFRNFTFKHKNSCKWEWFIIHWQKKVCKMLWKSILYGSTIQTHWKNIFQFGLNMHSLLYLEPSIHMNYFAEFAWMALNGICLNSHHGIWLLYVDAQVQKWYLTHYLVILPDFLILPQLLTATMEEDVGENTFPDLFSQSLKS